MLFFSLGTLSYFMVVLFNETKCFSKVFSFSSKRQLPDYGNILRPFGIFMMKIIAIKCQNVTFMEIAIFETFWYVHLEYFQCVTMQKIYQIRHSMELNNWMNLILIIMIIIMIWWWLLFQLDFHQLRWKLNTEDWTAVLKLFETFNESEKGQHHFYASPQIYLFRIEMKSKCYNIPLHPYQIDSGQPKWLRMKKNMNKFIVIREFSESPMVKHLFSSFSNGTTLNNEMICKIVNLLSIFKLEIVLSFMKICFFAQLLLFVRSHNGYALAFSQ